MNENRPNIVTVGLLAGAVAQLILWAWNGWLPAGAPELGPAESAALTTVMTAVAQYLDRWTKRQVGYVRGKYSDQPPGQPPP